MNEHKVDQPEKEEIACSCLVETRLTRVPNKAIPYQNKTTHLDPITCLEGTGPSLGAGDWRDGARALTKTAARPPGREQNKQKTKEHWTPTRRLSVVEKDVRLARASIKACKVYG